MEEYPKNLTDLERLGRQPAGGAVLNAGREHIAARRFQVARLRWSMPHVRRAQFFLGQLQRRVSRGALEKDLKFAVLSAFD
jgi:hypothetical protein